MILRFDYDKQMVLRIYLSRLFMILLLISSALSSLPTLNQSSMFDLMPVWRSNNSRNNAVLTLHYAVRQNKYVI